MVGLVVGVSKSDDHEIICDMLNCAENLGVNRDDIAPPASHLGLMEIM